MELEPLAIEGAWRMTPKQFGDDRGTFLEWYKAPMFTEAVGHPLELVQANCSVSRRGAVRGIHFADVPPSQAKYVTCLYGSVLDVIIDIRLGSPTFGQWDAVLLDTTDRRAVYVSEGLGHAFAVLEDQSTVTYLCSTAYSPEREHEVNPLDPELAIDWRLPADEIQLSAKDAAAPTLAEAAEAGLLPTWDAVQELRAGLRD